MQIDFNRSEEDVPETGEQGMGQFGQGFILSFRTGLKAR